jgi:hypothetical protein
MASPTTHEQMKQAMELIWNSPSEVLHTSLLSQMIPPKPPKLRGWWYRQWCALRGHGGTTNYPGSTTYYFTEGLCKRCGARICS